MRTTIDIPNSLFRQIKAAAAFRGETLRAFLLRAARVELATKTEAKKSRAKLPIVHSKETSYDVSPERLAEVLSDEDHELLAGH